MAAVAQGLPTLLYVAWLFLRLVARRNLCLAQLHPRDGVARPGVEITLHRRVGWEVLGQLPPLATGGRNVEDRIYHRSHVCRTRTTERRCWRQKRLHHKPLCISRIASISQALAPLMSTSDFSPGPVSYTHLRAHETRHDLVCRLLLEK